MTLGFAKSCLTFFPYVCLWYKISWLTLIYWRERKIARTDSTSPKMNSLFLLLGLLLRHSQYTMSLLKLSDANESPVTFSVSRLTAVRPATQPPIITTNCYSPSRHQHSTSEHPAPCYLDWGAVMWYYVVGLCLYPVNDWF